MSKIVENNNNIPKTNPFLEMIEKKKIYDSFINNGLCCNTCSKKITKLDIDAIVIPESNYLQEWFGFNIYHKCNQCLEKQKLNEFAKSCGWDGRCIKDYLAKAKVIPDMIKVGDYKSYKESQERNKFYTRKPTPERLFYEPQQFIPDNFCCKWAHNNRNICFGRGLNKEYRDCPVRHSTPRNDTPQSFIIAGLCRKGEIELKTIRLPELWKKLGIPKQPDHTHPCQFGFKHPIQLGPGNKQEMDNNPYNYCLTETIVDQDKWFPCPDCYPEYWHCAYEKYAQEEYWSICKEDLWGIGLTEEYIPRPPVYPSPFDTIPKYKQILPIINQPIHHQSVMLLGLIKGEENDRKVLEIEQGGKIKDQENKIKKLENELAELKQFILNNFNK